MQTAILAEVFGRARRGTTCIAGTAAVATVMGMVLIGLSFLWASHWVAFVSACIIAVLVQVLIGALMWRPALLRYVPQSLKTETQSSDLKVLVYAALALAAAIAYGHLALSTPSFALAGDKVVRWGYLDKRAFVFLYLAVIVAVAAFAATNGVFSTLSLRTPKPETGNGWRATLMRVSGAVAIAIASVVIFCVPFFNEIFLSPEKMTDIHVLVHLGSLQQIKDGATPYIEALTQYGPGNQLLLFYLTDMLGFTVHAFVLSNLAINAACIAILFGTSFLLLGWRFAAALLLGWILFPSPFYALHYLGWALLSRWIGVALVAVVLAATLFGMQDRKKYIGVAAAGAIWGGTAFLAQENLAGCAVVAVLMIFCALADRSISLPQALRYAATLGVAGTVVFCLLMQLSIGLDRAPEVLSSMFRGSSLVQSGISNTFWSGRIESAVLLRNVFYTYLMPFIYILGLAIFLSADLVDALFPKGLREMLLPGYCAALVGGGTLHIFSLWRSDNWHLYGGATVFFGVFLSVLLYVLYRARGNRMIFVVFIFFAAFFVDGVMAAVKPLGSKVTDTLGSLSRAYGDIVTARRFVETAMWGRSPAKNAFEQRYSTSEAALKQLRASPAYRENVEFVDLVRRNLNGRSVVGYHASISREIRESSSFYFFSDALVGHRITSPHMSIWLASELKSFIDDAISSDVDCIISDRVGPKLKDDVLYAAWRRTHGDRLTDTVLKGRRQYAVLSCKGSSMPMASEGN